MTSGFDDAYNLSPERQVKMTYALGYRDWWTTYIGMSHYWKGLTAFENKVTKELVIDADVLEYPVLFAGESNMKVHFVAGTYPLRGQDAYQKKMTEDRGINYAGVRPIDGATSTSAADRACAVNPDSVVFDPDGSLGTYGGLWWWDLEADAPGPALLHAVEQMGEDTPKAVYWSQGKQDATVLKFPGDRTPVPSIARTKLATKKVFEYFRAQWGADLPIIIQEEGRGWACLLSLGGIRLLRSFNRRTKHPWITSPRFKSKSSRKRWPWVWCRTSRSVNPGGGMVRITTGKARMLPACTTISP